MPVAVRRRRGRAQVGVDTKQALRLDLLSEQELKEALENEGHAPLGWRQPCVHGSSSVVPDQGGPHHRRLLLQTEGEADDHSEPLAEDHEGG